MKWALLSGVVALAACHPHPPSAPVRKTTLGLAIDHFELGNGLEVVLVKDPKATEIQTTMRYRVGAVDDPAGQEGMAHLVEHLMFQQVLGGQSLFDQLETFATSFNGTTSLDATTYTARAKPEHLEKLLSIEGVRVGFRCTTITDATFDREREVVINEIRQREPSSATYLAVQRSIFPIGHPYARSPGGNEQTLRSITREQACAFADAHYTTRNSVLVVSGDLTEQRVTAALTRFLAKLPARPTAPLVAVAPPPARRVDVPGPVDSTIVVIGWPLPTDPMLRSRIRAVLGTAVSWVDNRVKGRVQRVELGDERALLAGVAIELADGETATEVLSEASTVLANASFSIRALDRVDLGGVVYDQIRQTAVHGIFSRLEDGSDRDIRFATEVLAGRDPRASIAAELDGLRGLDRASMVSIAESALQVNRASVLVMTPEAKAPRAKTEISPPIHDQGQRRDPPDPALAQQPVVKDLGARGFAQMRTRTLPNGLSIVLLPIASVPTVDIRMVFRAGAADETTTGAALVAGYGLEWNLSHLNDVLLFYGAGGTFEVDVGADHVAFAVRGMEMHLDALLAGLRRRVMDGIYTSRTESLAQILRGLIKETQHEGALSDAWAAALYGGDHPYAKFASARRLSPQLSGVDGAQFHDQHLTPSNATLVIAGGFDPALADRWIDFLFTPWQGQTSTRSERPAVFQRVSLAHDEPAEQTYIRLAFPASTKNRARQLVLAEMLSIVVGEVRHQLGASYGVHASLVDHRLGARYLVGGYIETRRLAEATKLIHDRLGALQDDPAEAARTFVIARERVLTRLMSLPGQPSALSDLMVADIAHDRAPLSNLAVALDVQRMIVSTVNVYELDIDAAAVLMQGPKASLDPAFLALGRIATYVTPPKVAIPEAMPARAMLTDGIPSYLEMPLTYQGERNPFSVTVGASYGAAEAFDSNFDGLQLTGKFLYQFDRRTSFAAGLSLGSYATTGQGTPQRPVPDIDVMPLGIMVGIQALWADRVWTAAYVGVHAARVTANGTSSWTNSAGAELLVGIDVLKFGKTRVGVFGRVETAPTTDISFSSFTAGAAIRQKL